MSVMNRLGRYQVLMLVMNWWNAFCMLISGILVEPT